MVKTFLSTPVTARTIAAASIFLFPLAAAATTGSLSTDFDLFEEELREMQQEEAQQQTDREIESSGELFPKVEVDLPEGRSLKEDSLHLTIRVDGFPVILSDVELAAWFAPYVRDIAEKGIISGYRDAEGFPLGLFGPADNVTIEQLAKMVVESAGIDPGVCAGELKNTSVTGSWSEDYILCAEQRGWAVFSDGSVLVHRLASRSEVVVTVLQAFGVRFAGMDVRSFSDVTSSTEFAVAIETAAMDGIVAGYSDESGVPTGEFGPYDPVNRAEVAKILSLALQVY